MCDAFYMWQVDAASCFYFQRALFCVRRRVIRALRDIRELVVTFSGSRSIPSQVRLRSGFLGFGVPVRCSKQPEIPPLRASPSAFRAEEKASQDIQLCLFSARLAHISAGCGSELSAAFGRLRSVSFHKVQSVREGLSQRKAVREKHSRNESFSVQSIQHSRRR